MMKMACNYMFTLGREVNLAVEKKRGGIGLRPSQMDIEFKPMLFTAFLLFLSVEQIATIGRKKRLHFIRQKSLAACQLQ